MPEFNDDDKDWIRQMREIRHLVTPDVKWSDDAEHDPLGDVKTLVKGMGVAGERKMEFYCGLHGQQGADKVVFGGFELECGCRITKISHKWVFTTLEDRELNNE